MPRSRRIDIPGLPLHLNARGNNRGTCFFRDQDRRIYLRYLADAAQTSQCDIHAFVLMSNHVHLLATGRSTGSISKMMQAVGRRYARYVNDSHGRTGGLYEGRFHSSPIETERYLLTCMRYIELNPVRAGMVAAPESYCWSSFVENAGGAPSGWLTAHPEYLRLAREPAQRGAAYRALFASPVSDEDLRAIREHIGKNRALGGSGFTRGLEATLQRSVGIVKPGRPRKAPNLSPFQGEK